MSKNSIIVLCLAGSIVFCIAIAAKFKLLSTSQADQPESAIPVQISRIPVSAEANNTIVNPFQSDDARRRLAADLILPMLKEHRGHEGKVHDVRVLDIKSYSSTGIKFIADVSYRIKNGYADNLNQGHVLITKCPDIESSWCVFPFNV